MARKKESRKSKLDVVMSLLAENKITQFEYKDPSSTLRIKCIYKAKEIRQETVKEFQKKEETQEKQEDQTYILKSKYVGFFHILMKKDENQESEPFVRTGDRVGLEDILAVIDSMRLHSEIKLEDYKDFKGDYGIIETIEEDESSPVDYGRPLFRIKPGFEPEIILKDKESLEG